MSIEIGAPLNMSSTLRKQESYVELLALTRGLIDGERDWLASLSNFSALVFSQVPDLNWAGFYVARDGELVLGPFQGKVACIRIPFERGVCGACARTGEAQIVPDVHQFEGHIACDAASRSELVVPLMRGEELLGVFDLDSPIPARFDIDDAQGIAKAIAHLAQGTNWLEPVPILKRLLKD
ncbi:MAG: GAF domain-containing protein [Paucibacter sp.]|nr:GAF domain-containing protein [Roseateles sp.]